MPKALFSYENHFVVN